MKRNKKKDKKKERKKFPYRSRLKDKKGGLGDVFGALGLIVLGFVLGFFLGDRILQSVTEWIGGLFTNGLR